MAKFYKLSNKAYEQYKLNTKGNGDVSKFDARRKLSRNIALGKVYAEDDVFVDFAYGNLFIRVLKEHDIIVSVHVEYTYQADDIDGIEYERVSKEFGLTKEAMKNGSSIC